MSIDPLDFFHQLDLKKQRKPESPKEEQKTYPGRTPPRNAPQALDSEQEAWLNSLPSQSFSVNGEIRKFYTIGALAQALGKQPVTLRSWESKGWLPPASFRTPTPRGTQVPGKAQKGRRLYSKEQLLFLTEAHKKYLLAPRYPNWEGFKSYIKQQYPR